MAVCGDGFDVFNDVVGVSSLASVVRLAIGCGDVKANFRQAVRAVECATSLSATCPVNIGPRRKRQTKTVDLQHKFAATVGLLDGAKDPVTSALDTLGRAQDAAGTMLAKFHRLFQLTDILLAPDVLRFLQHDAGGAAFGDAFLKAISDTSTQGAFITPQEARSLLVNSDRSVIGDSFVVRWNTTVDDWRRGFIETDVASNSAPYPAIVELVRLVTALKAAAVADRLKNPFELLDKEMGVLLDGVQGSNATNPPQLCANAYVTLLPDEMEENSAFKMALRLVNRFEGGKRLDEVKVAFDFEQIDRPLFTNRPSPRIVFSAGAPVLSKILSIDGQSSLESSAEMNAQWRVLSTVETPLASAVFFTPNLVASFVANGRRVNRRLNSHRVKFTPKPSLKLYHFLYADVSDGILRPFTVRIALMNTGYTSLSSVRLVETRFVLTSKTDLQRFVPYQVTGMSCEHHRSELTGTSQTVYALTSGSTAFIAYNLTSDAPSSMEYALTTVMHGAEGISLADRRSFFVVRSISDAMLLAERRRLPPQYLFSDIDSQLTELVQLEFRQSEEDPADEENRRLLKATFTLRLDNSFLPASARPAYGSVILPFLTTSNNQLIQASRLSKDDSSLSYMRLSDVWIATDASDDRHLLNFVDTTLLRPSLGSIQGSPSTIQYRFLFGKAVIGRKPLVFKPDKYQLTVNQNSIAGTTVLTTVVTDEDTSEHVILYDLYGGDSHFSINRRTGEIKLVSTLTPGKPLYCLTVVASDANAVRPRTARALVSVYIDSNSSPYQCLLLNNTGGLTSHTHDNTTNSSTTTPAIIETSSTTVIAATTSTNSTVTSTSTAPIVSASTESATTTSTTGGRTTVATASTLATTTVETGGVVDPSPSTVVSTSSASTTSNGATTTATTSPTALSSSSSIELSTVSGGGGVTTTTPLQVVTEEIDEEKLVKMACSLRDTKPIWGVICDFGKIKNTGGRRRRRR